MGAALTKSEQLFEAFCRGHGIVYRRVPVSAARTPDYELELAGGAQLLAEVKQFDPNRQERAALARQAKGETVAFSSTPGERLRHAIKDADGQLRELLAGRTLPTLLVVYNNTPCRLHTQPYAVMTAMQGLDVIDVEVPEDRSARLRFRPPRSGPRRAMRADANTSVSAVTVLEEDVHDALLLSAYLNRYAATPLPPHLLDLPGVHQFRLPALTTTNSLDARWEPVTPAHP